MSFLKRINKLDPGLSGHLRELKVKALKESPFRFFRGTCYLFAQDLAKVYKYKQKVKSWTCGDLHFENFGSFKDDNRLVYFDINDFDESFLGSPDLEMTRFLTSIIVASAQAGTAFVKVHKAVHDLMHTYTDTIRRGKPYLMEVETAHGEFKKFFEQMSTLNRQEFIEKHTEKVKGSLMLKTDGEHFEPIVEQQKCAIFASLEQLLQTEPRFSHLVYEDAAYRVAGTGSLGLDRYCVLVFSKKKGKHYLIDIKESRPSSYSSIFALKQPRFSNEAERTILTGHFMQYTSPAFQTTLKMDDKWHVVRELQPKEDKMDLHHESKDFNGFVEVACEMAKLVAYAHLRSSGHMGAATADDLMHFVKKAQWQQDIIELSGLMAKKNEKYYKQFCKQ